MMSHLDDQEDLLGSDGSEWLEQVTSSLVTHTPQKIRLMATNTPGSTRTVRGSSQTSTRTGNFRGSSSPSRSGLSPALSRMQISSSGSPRGSKPKDVMYISLEEGDADAEDTESDTDTDSVASIFDRGAGPSRQTTMSSVTSFPPPISKTPSMQSDDFLKRAISPPTFCDDLTLSPSPSLRTTPDDPFTSISSASLSPTPAEDHHTGPDPSVNTLGSLPNLASSPLKTLFPSGPSVNLHIQHYIIEHDRETQAVFDNPRALVPWGTQFELARGVQLKKWSWEKVREKIDHFAGKSDEEAMRLVYYIMTNETPPALCKSDIGKEYDREQIAILENKGRGLGLMGDWFGADDWFGGQIQQIATLKEIGVGKKLSLQLEPPEMKRSSRFARKFSSRRVLQVRIADDFLRGPNKARVVRFLSRKFILNGRVFAPTPPKESAVYLVEVDEDYERMAESRFGDQHRLSLGGILEWHNPLSMGLNSQQPITKYAARAALALSNSVPALIFEVENIHFIDDLVTSDCKDKKPPAYKILTDGCGFINQAGLRAITIALNYPSRPTAVQGRIAGSKGLWTVHPYDTSDVPQIWIRDSQRKIVYPNFDSIQQHRVNYSHRHSDLCRGHYTYLDRAHCIFDLCHASLPSLSMTGSMVSLKKQSVLNLWANGVKIDVFKTLMEKGLQELIAPLTQWDSGQFAMPALWDAINKIGRVSHIRTARLSAGRARALGLAGRDYGKEGSAGNSDASSTVSSASSSIYAFTETGRNEISGEPLTLHETALELVQAGFHPARDAILWSSLKQILRVALQGAIDKCSIPLPEGSAVTAFVIPDPLGVLNENEVYFKSSTPIKNPVTQTLFHVITGDVLIGRYPLRVRSDVQKVTAVDIPELAQYSDVIIVPTKPSHSVQGLVTMMSKCSGGDHDGDELFLISLKVLVDAFQPSELKFPAEDLAASFENEVKKVPEFLREVEKKSIPDAQSAFIFTLLSGLADSSVGLYDFFHDKAVRLHGYDSKEAERLAFLFNELLDAPKTGKVLLAEVRDSDQNNSRKISGELKKRDSDDFIFDTLKAFADELLNTHLEKFDQLPSSDEKSSIILEPYRNAQRLCEISALPVVIDEIKHIASACGISPEAVGKSLQAARRKDLELIEKHVDDAYREFCAKAVRRRESEEENLKRNSDSLLMLPVAFSYARDIPGLTDALPNVDHVKASYAYHRAPKFYFAKAVAFRSLCEIQVAASNEGGAPCLRILDQFKSISGGARRLFQQ